MFSSTFEGFPGEGAMHGYRSRRPWARAGETASARTRHAELLILCARIDFNP
jgi:hypothetical protein